jgi:L-ascorbate metabolism protein UlaG (beta-lactamase superfamily)
MSGSYGGDVRYSPIHEAADAVTVSHHHQDHDGASLLPGKPKVFDRKGAFKVESIGLQGLETFHDPNRGAQRGRNLIFVFEVDGVRVCHCGDLGHILDPEQAAAIGKVDVLLVPVGGTFTVDATAAHKVAAQLAARVVIPMHYKTGKLGFDIAGVEEFVQGQDNVKRVGRSEVEVSADGLPQAPEIWVLDHAL